MTRVIILGSHGMLGSMLTKYFNLHTDYIVYGLNRNDFDVKEDPLSRLNGIIKDYRYKTPNEYKDTYVINCIGIINRHNNTQDMIEVNSLFPHKLAEYLKYKARLIHISTDCVFNGNGDWHSEKSIPDAIDDYGKTKSLGELTQNAITLRTSIIGFERKNKYSFLEWVIKNKNCRVNGYNYLLWNGMTTLELAKRITKIIDYNLYEEGLFNLYSSSHTKYEMIKAISNVFNLNIKIDIVNLDKTYSKRLMSLYPLNDNITNEFDFFEQLKELKDFHTTFNYPS